MKALLFINGTPPQQIPDLEGYAIVGCTDGAFHYLKSLDFPLEKLNFVSGDFDSHPFDEETLQQTQHDKLEVISTPDQDKTDFEKALQILQSKGVLTVDVFGGSGKEMDHFLGNLTAAFQFKEQMEIKFHDEFSSYFFIPKQFKMNDVKGKMISLYPFPIAENVKSTGLNWELDELTLEMTSRIGTRNFAKSDEVSLVYSKGDLLVFIGQKYL